MSIYTTGYSIRYAIPKLQQQAEFAVITAADQVKNEDPGNPDHANRIEWAGWADANSVQATWAFMWPLAMNTSIQNSIISDPTGESVPDTDVQFVVNSNLEFVIASWVANKPA